jgi:hypothetical protein
MLVLFSIRDSPSNLVVCGGFTGLICTFKMFELGDSGGLLFVADEAVMLP